MKLKHVIVCLALLAAIGASSPGGSTSAAAATHASVSQPGLTGGQKVALYAIAYQTWRFFDADTDPNTHLPMDNLGLYGAPSGPYTSPTNIGVNFWSIVAAHDLGFINYNGALQRANAELTEIEQISKWNGFLFSWYATTNGHRISGPGGTDQQGQPATGAFISTVDNAWYATGLILVRQEFPTLAARATSLLNAMDFGIFYDNGDQSTNVNAGQMYGGYTVGTGPATFHYGLLNTETRIAAYIGIGTHKMPGDVWWRTYRTLPANVVNEQTPKGYNVVYQDPQSGKQFTVFEGHYSYGNINFVPSFGGSMFEGLMDNLVVPETRWGPHSFGLNDLRYAQAQIAYTKQTLHYPVWGLSPSSTPDDTGGYQAYGAHGLATNGNDVSAYAETAVTPHASFLALDVDPQDAFANIEKLLTHYKIFDRYLVLDQSMIMAALDNALRGNLMQQHFSQDPVIAAAQPYLSEESFSIS